MNEANTAPDSPWLTFAHAAWYVCAALAALVLLGAIPVYYTRFIQPIHSDLYGLGRFSAPFQILVDAGDYLGSVMSFALALLLFWRKPNDRMALFVSFFCLVTAITGLFILSNVLTAYFAAPSTYEFWSNLQGPLWILLFCTLPDGRFVPRWTRWLFLVSIPLSLPFEHVFQPDWSLVSNALTFVTMILVMFAQVYRYRRVSSFAERQQTKWWLYGMFIALALSLVASLIYRYFSPPLVNVTPIFLTIAILRSRLWDIDVVIRKTVTYSALTALLAVVYFGGVVLLQRLFGALTGVEQSPLALVVSTLAIAALFTPLRRRIQDAIDRRFYRKKYDAQQVLAQFAQTARDETDLDALLAELVHVAQGTLQPGHASIWLKDSRGRRDHA